MIRPYFGFKAAIVAKYAKRIRVVFKFLVHWPSHIKHHTIYLFVARRVNVYPRWQEPHVQLVVHKNGAQVAALVGVASPQQIKVHFGFNHPNSESCLCWNPLVVEHPYPHQVVARPRWHAHNSVKHRAHPCWQTRNLDFHNLPVRIGKGTFWDREIEELTQYGHLIFDGFHNHGCLN